MDASTSSSSRLPPIPRVRQTTLDRAAFEVSLPVLAARIPARKTGPIKSSPLIASQLLHLPRMPVIMADPSSSEHRLLLLDIDDESGLSSTARDYLQQECDTVELITYDLKLDYSYWSAAEVIRAILPDELAGDEQGTPTSYTTTGHLAHMNLRDEYLPYRHAIGRIILDKSKGLRTVVNKLDSIDTEFRFFRMEVLAGDEDFLVSTTHCGCKFSFDFSTVYWNSRLETEHLRLVSDFQPGELVADVMGGVGPFAVPAAKKGCFVLGNDLNPSSAQSMEKNRVDNKVQATLRVSNEDGRAFIRSSPLSIYLSPFAPLPPPKPKVTKASKTAPATPAPTPAPPPASPSRFINHFVMNLPSNALEFLDAYRGAFVQLAEHLEQEDTSLSRADIPMPMIHVHCFSRFEEAEAERDICERASSALGSTVSREVSTDFRLHEVRRVAPNKLMFCLSFRLSPEIAFAQPVSEI